MSSTPPKIRSESLPEETADSRPKANSEIFELQHLGEESSPEGKKIICPWGNETIVALDVAFPPDGILYNTPKLRAIMRSLRPEFNAVLRQFATELRDNLASKIVALEHLESLTAEQAEELSQAKEKLEELIEEPFKDIESLGRGGFGEVFRAVDVISGDTVALKIMFDILSDSLYKRAIAEAKTLIALGNKEEIVQGYYLMRLGPKGIKGIPESGNRLLIEMEYVDGKSLIELASECLVMFKEINLSISDPYSTVIVEKMDFFNFAIFDFAQLNTDELKNYQLSNNRKLRDLEDDETIPKEDIPELLKIIKKLYESVILKYVIKYCRGLAKAHKAGIVHRDIKPDNLMMDKEGRGVIVDWGLLGPLLEGRLIDQGFSNRSLAYQKPDVTHSMGTRASRVGYGYGAALYSAPEYVSRGELSASMDTWSLGVTLAYVLTGQYPFLDPESGDISNQLIKYMDGDEDSEISAGLDEIENQLANPALMTIIRKALGRKPEDRYATITDFGDALESYVESTG